MSRADEIFIQNCKDILENGIWDTDRPVRTRWEDGTPAHTIKKFCIVNRYDLAEEFPILTIRRIYWKSAIDELLWIWQAKSNNVKELRTRVWDAWADENGSIGKAYGYQLGVKHHYPEGDMDQVDKVLWDLKHNPASRRIMTNIYNFADLSEMALYPCAYSMTFNVTGNKLNAILNQRSQDMLTANNWNVVQYAALTLMLVFGLCFPAAASAESFLSTSPKTGDVNNLVLWIAIVAGSAIVLAVLAFLLLRKNKKKKK